MESVKNIFNPAVGIILLICLINAGSTVALYSTANKTAIAAHASADAAEVSANTANQSAAAALKLANSNLQLIEERLNQICRAELPKTDQPAFCKDPTEK